MASLSTSDDVHAVRMFGHSFSYNGKRYDALPVYSGASLTAETTPSETGKWLFSSTLRHHIEGGMQTLITVAQCGCHTGTETRPRLLREAAVGNIGQWAEA